MTTTYNKYGIYMTKERCKIKLENGNYYHSYLFFDGDIWLDEDDYNAITFSGETEDYLDTSSQRELAINKMRETIHTNTEFDFVVINQFPADLNI